MKSGSRAWLASLALLFACVGVAGAAERSAMDGSGRVREKLQSLLRREPPPRIPPVFSVLGSRIIRSNTGTVTSRVLDVRYAGTSGYLEAIHNMEALQDHPIVDDLGGGRFLVTLRTSDVTPAGTHRGVVKLRMCTESPCVNAIEGASLDLLVWVLVNWVNGAEWTSFQGNASHTGYVGIVVDPEKISGAWSWNADKDASFGWLQGVATSPGRGFVTYTDYNTGHSLVAFDPKDGSMIWRQSFPDANSLNASATSGDRVYVTTTGQQETFLWSFDASDGTPKSQSTFQIQWGVVLAPTIAHGIAYVNGGYYDKGVYAFDADDGLPLWSAFSGENDESTPAVADGRVHYYDGYRLKIYDAFDGAELSSIDDPLAPEWHGYSYRAAPMLGSPDHVLAFSGSNIYGDRRLVDFSPAGQTSRWQTTRSYGTHPAINAGTIYAASNSPKSFDAIDETTGQVLRSWVPGTSDTSFFGNVVLTKNLAFVSTDVATYAIDLATHLPVWSVPVSGMLSVSGSGMLYIVEHGIGRAGRIVAYRLH
jgi:outer membrane protein assembly factor BamB